MEADEKVTVSLRPREAAKALGVSARTLWTWTKRFGIPHVRVGNVVLYPVDALQEWLRQREHRSG